MRNVMRGFFRIAICDRIEEELTRGCAMRVSTGYLQYYAVSIVRGLLRGFQNESLLIQNVNNP